MSRFCLAQGDTRTFFELAPLLPLDQWWQGGLLLVTIIAVTAISVWLYRRDSGNLPRSIAVTLLALRLLAFAGLLIFFLGPEKRSESRIVRPSRLAVLIDNSLSMGLSDSIGESAEQPRMDSVVSLIQDAGMLEVLNRDHELVVYRFGEASRPEAIATFRRTSDIENRAAGVPNPDLAGSVTALKASKRIGWLGQVILVMAFAMLSASVLLTLLNTHARPWTLAAGSLLLAGAVLFLALSDLLTSEYPLPVSLGWRSPAQEMATPQTTAPQTDASPSPEWSSMAWQDELAPEGVATQAGSALDHVVQESRGRALAGILLVTDGQSNQGMQPARAIASASDANIPVYVIGVGSNRQARNVRVSEVEAPSRVFPNDDFRIKAIVQSFGFAGETVSVQLRSVEEGNESNSEMEDQKSVSLPLNGEPLNVQFDVTSQQEGRRRYFIEVIPPAGDIDPSDNMQSATVQFLMRKSKVLLIAGGPTRDYQFLRNQMFRDENIELDVWLQIARPGSDQESDDLLFGFPESMEALSQYDCIVAFDPDWRLLSTEQARLLERWVSEMAGGMLVVAGPVNTPEWTRRARGEEAIDLIRRLYPVSFYSQGSAALKLGRFGGKQPFPLEFSREGRTAKHLWLGGEDAGESFANWNSFDGVYGYYAVNEPKAGAEVLARFSDESTAIEGELPIYLASQFYGAGRVFFQASGEIWRLRTIDVTYFESYYRNLIRWVSEGRLLRDSSRGVLLLDRNRCWVGDQLVVRAILRDASDQPLLANEVNATIRLPDGSSRTLRLSNTQDVTRPGTFSGRFVASMEGSFEVTLPIPGDVRTELLHGSVRATIPELEKRNPQRNDALLQTVADQTGGIYFYNLQSDGQVSWNSVVDENRTEQAGNLIGDNGLGSMIGVVDNETFLPGSPDEQFARKLARWLLLWLVLVLCTEWTVRRLNKLA